MNLIEIKQPISLKLRSESSFYADDLKPFDEIKPISKSGLPYPVLKYKVDCNSWVQFDFDNFDYFVLRY